MSDVIELMIHNKLYRFCSFHGDVAETSRQRETLVSGYGGGGATYDGTGATAPVNITSRTIVHDEFFLVNEQGEEEHFHLQNWTLPTRVGHKLQMIWIIPPKQQKGPTVLMNNKNLRQSERADGRIQELAKNHYSHIKWGGLIAAFILPTIFKTMWLFFIIAIGSYIFYRKKVGEVEREIHQQIDNMLV